MYLYSKFIHILIQILIHGFSKTGKTIFLESVIYIFFILYVLIGYIYYVKKILFLQLYVWVKHTRLHCLY